MHKLHEKWYSCVLVFVLIKSIHNDEAVIRRQDLTKHIVTVNSHDTPLYRLEIIDNNRDSDTYSESPSMLTFGFKTPAPVAASGTALLWTAAAGKRPDAAAAPRRRDATPGTAPLPPGTWSPPPCSLCNRPPAPPCLKQHKQAVNCVPIKFIYTDVKVVIVQS